jgi:hypothetical protein
MAQLWASLPTATCAVQAREKEEFHHLGAQKRLRLTPEVYHAGRHVAGSDYPIQPIAWIGRGPVMISKLSRNLNVPLKSESSDHPPGRKLAYRNRKRTDGASGARLAAQVITSIETENKRHTRPPQRYIVCSQLR